MRADPNEKRKTKPSAKPVERTQKPLEGPLPRSGVLDREQPECADGPGLPPREKGAGASPKAAHDAAGVESVAGEEDPGASLDAPSAPPSPDR